MLSLPRSSHVGRIFVPQRWRLPITVCPLFRDSGPHQGKYIVLHTDAAERRQLSTSQGLPMLKTGCCLLQVGPELGGLGLCHSDAHTQPRVSKRSDTVCGVHNVIPQLCRAPCLAHLPASITRLQSEQSSFTRYSLLVHGS